MSLAPYRKKWNPETNVPRDTRICGSFTIGTSGAITATTVRPGAVSDSTGLLFTVAQGASYYSLTNANAYLVTITENYLQPSDVTANYALWVAAGYNPAYAAGAAATTPFGNTVAQVTMLDGTANAFVIGLCLSSTGVICSSANATIAAGSVWFQAGFINSNSPVSQ